MTDRGGHRVVITGLGAINSAGVGADTFTEAIRAGRDTTSPIRGFDTTGFPAHCAGEVHDDPATLVRRIDPTQWGRSGQLAAAAARMAVTDAGLSDTDLAALAVGSCMGTTSGESAVIERLVGQWVDADALKVIDGAAATQVPAARIANAVNRELGLTGEAQTIATACSASNYALGYGFDMIRTGEADAMITGGADSLNRWAHAGFFRLGALAETTCRPFDADRAGILTAEGGVALVLERRDHALARGARIYAEVLGYALNCDAEHMVHPDPTSIAKCIAAAHERAGIKAEDVDYICAHGTGTPTNDSTETAAVRAVFGEQPPPMSSIKSMIGHTMGAASGFGALICARALYDGFLPPTANLETPDPALGAGMDFVANHARPASPRIAENHGFAFGGNNAITILGAHS